MTDSIDHLDKLEQKLLKAVELFKKTHAERRALQQEFEKLPEDYKDRLKRADTLEREVQALRTEREQVRNRIEKLLEQIEILTKAESAG
jgi:FtsZ-binding cell division protein ZapB